MIPYFGSFLAAHVNQIANQSRQTLSFNAILKDKVLISKVIRGGVPMDVFTEIQEKAYFADAQWCDWMGITVRTLQRYRKDSAHRFSPVQGQRIFEVAEVIAQGKEVFDSPEHFKIWLETPSLALGNEKPVTFLDSSYGKDLLLSELDRIEYGVFV